MIQKARLFTLLKSLKITFSFLKNIVEHKNSNILSFNVNLLKLEKLYSR